MTERRVHADFINAWANGMDIQILTTGVWVDDPNPTWDPLAEYRVKPVARVITRRVKLDSTSNILVGTTDVAPSVRFTFDAETKRLTSAQFVVITKAVATSSANNQITVSSGIDLAVGMKLAFSGTVFGNIQTGIDYYVLTVDVSNPANQVITVGLSPTDTAVILSDATGSMDIEATLV